MIPKKSKLTERGRIPEDWEVVNLGEATDILTGFPFSGGKYSGEGIRVIRGENISVGFIRWDTDKRWNYSIEGLEKYCLADGDVVIGMDGSKVGQNRARIKSKDLPLLLAQRVARLRANQNLNQNYLYYIIFSDRFFNHVESVRTGTSIPHISSKQIAEFKIALPPIQEQQAIAKILSDLDDKIALNRSINSTLEAIGQALFKHWFVDFEFPNEEGKSYKSSGGEMVNSEFGEIPKGWAVVTVAETCESIFSGGTPNTQAKHYWGGEIPWLSSGETRSRFIIDTEKTITEAGVANSSTRIARSGCTVIAGAGQGHTRGQTSLLTFESYINQSVVALSANPKVSSDLFLFFDLKQRYDEFRQLSDSHSSRGSLTTKLLAGVKVVLPPRELIEKFDKTVGYVVALIIANLHQSHTLAALRDALLPKLMSGEIRVSTNNNLNNENK